MNKCALCIPRPGTTSKVVQQGYIDTLRHMGWKVYITDPKMKMGCRKFIEEYGVRLILTHSRYGIRQLPVDSINQNNVTVFVDALPCNVANSTINGPYELAHNDEPEVVYGINSVLAHTKLEPHLWDKYMQRWEQQGVNLIHVPVAGNILKAVPSMCSRLTDVAMVANFAHRQGIMNGLIQPLFQRIKLLGYSYQAFGDDIWLRAGLDYNGTLGNDANQLAKVYATAGVCPNVHTERQVGLQACVNERSFMIPLCGGVQVSDNPLVSRYLGSHCAIAGSVTDFINMTIDSIDIKHGRFDEIRSGVDHVAHNHTYFNRLVNMFHIAKLHDHGGSIRAEGKRVADRHCWEMDARLTAAEGGVKWEGSLI